MPELPEVHTTVEGLKKNVIDKTITGVWTDYNSLSYEGKDNIKNPDFFKVFKKNVLHTKIIGAERRAKNILISLSNKKTILIHMKMTGHLMYGSYHKTTAKERTERNTKETWLPDREDSALADPFNKWIHFAIQFKNSKVLVLSDMRKFAKVTLIDTEGREKTSHLEKIGPEPLEPSFTFSVFKNRLRLRENQPIKQALMNQELIAGIGNIYSDEALFRAGIHPRIQVKKLENTELKKIYAAVKKVLRTGIDVGGDSMSDYRNIDGERGAFQGKHKVYGRTGLKCIKKGCSGIVKRIIVGGRSAHFCSVCQSKNYFIDSSKE